MTHKKLSQIEKRIEKVRAKLALIEKMRPGSLTKQYKDPKQHTGAYYQLSYTLEMKSRTEYIRTECVSDIRRQIRNYKRFKKLCADWVVLSIEYSRLAMKLMKNRR